MQALVFVGPGELELQSIELPSPARDEVLLRVEAVGICGSDIDAYIAKTGRCVPRAVMGHEAAGVVVAIGSDVDGWAEGMRVTFNPL